MSLYIATVEEQIADYQGCIHHFERARNRYYYKQKATNSNNRIGLQNSIDYFNSRLIHYRAKIKDLQQWRDG